ncbi:hypothetical protein Trydic_g11043 [Trypoxylus dichotomus]
MGTRGEHRAFVVEKYIRNDSSVITTQRAFRIRFGWVSNFKATDFALRKKSPGGPRTAITLENVTRVRASIQQSPKRSGLIHAAALALFDKTARRILHGDLHMHPYKMVVTQELTERF